MGTSMMKWNAMRLKERHDWAIIYRVSTANKLKRQNELVLQNKSSLNVFSLKGFLQKVLLNLFKKALQHYKARKITRDFI